MTSETRRKAVNQVMALFPAYIRISVFILDVPVVGRATKGKKPTCTPVYCFDLIPQGEVPSYN